MGICVDEKPRIPAPQRAQGYLRLPDGKAVNGVSHCYKRDTMPGADVVSFSIS
ncbi:MAG TPA: hypothetical protein VK789_13150 [Bryobacteraceae bacterium]|nr:hypothetical protein [Bryobacteraceae bacterium]